MEFMNQPLADLLRPKNLNDFVGQRHLVGKNGIITKLLSSKSSMPSLIFWGPPGVGKTTLARIISSELNLDYYEFSAVSTSTKDIQALITKPSQLLIFLDEIHRWNKAQQDRLLPHVESGKILLVGATTENPSFSVISPLLSRARVLTLKQLEEAELEEILNRALKKLNIKISPEAKKFLLESSNGDARILLTTIEITANINSKSETLNTKHVETALQRRQLEFDKQGEEFYNTISAFIKSMRASQPDAALYYLARMIEAGQDPLYIARRMVIFASEDIGLAQPTAIVVANEVFRACETIGLPECAINLAHGVAYLSNAKKDRTAYNAYNAAKSDVLKYGNLPVPLKIRNAPTKFMKSEGYGKGYQKYDRESYLPDKIKYKKYLR